MVTLDKQTEVTEATSCPGIRIFSKWHGMCGVIVLQEIADGAGVVFDNGEDYIVEYSDMCFDSNQSNKVREKILSLWNTTE